MLKKKKLKYTLIDILFEREREGERYYSLLMLYLIL